MPCLGTFGYLCFRAGQTQNGSPGRTRTSDPAVNSRLLYRLSYRGIPWPACLAQARCDGYIKIESENPSSLSDADSAPAVPRKRIRIGSYSIPVPGSRIARMAVGVLLIFGGFFGFLPILGFWMVPLGLLVLSIDLPFVRRFRRRIEVWWGRRNNKPKNGRNGKRTDTV
jgi:hypothetical protein